MILKIYQIEESRLEKDQYFPVNIYEDGSMSISFSLGHDDYGIELSEDDLNSPEDVVIEKYLEKRKNDILNMENRKSIQAYKTIKIKF